MTNLPFIDIICIPRLILFMGGGHIEGDPEVDDEGSKVVER